MKIKLLKSLDQIGDSKQIPLLSLLLLFMINGCSEYTPPLTDSKTQNKLPPAVQQLRSVQNGSVFVSVSINGQLYSNMIPVNDENTSVSLDTGFFENGSNSVEIAFYFESNAISQRVFVTGTQTIDFSDTTTELQFSGLNYRYSDSDGDGLYDVHELAKLPIDIDNDGISNVDDTDSDDDGIEDGGDSTPWGEDSTNDFSALLAELDINLPDGTTNTIMIDRAIGGSGEISSIARDSNSPMSFRFPTGWPTGEIPPMLSEIRWTAFELRTESTGLCDHFRLPLDVSSIELQTDQLVLLYVKRLTGPSYMTSLSQNKIDNLDIFDHTPPIDGDGPWNDALRVLLVPEFHIGWINLWTDKSLEGQVCEINLNSQGNV